MVRTSKEESVGCSWQTSAIVIMRMMITIVEEPGQRPLHELDRKYSDEKVLRNFQRSPAAGCSSTPYIACHEEML